MQPSEGPDTSEPPSGLLAAVSVLCLDGGEASGTDGASVSLSGAELELSPLWATDGTARALEERQVTLGEGPCLDAATLRRPVLVDDLRNPPGGSAAWPGFLSDVTSLGVRGLFAFPLQIGAVVIGTLELYRRAPGRLSDSELGAALDTADLLGGVLVGLGAASGVADVVPPYRMVVHQAAGMLTIQLDVSIVDAMMRLRGRAFGEGRSINDVAADVVSGTIRLDEEEP
jgi:hypothetical protein